MHPSLFLPEVLVYTTINIMSTQDNNELKTFAQLVGRFIRYWGFRNIHGEIWTLVYLAERSLSASEIVEILGCSKALVSTGLNELVDEGLIFLTESENAKVKRYMAVDDVSSVIRKVLNRRELPLLEKVEESFETMKLQKQNQIGLSDERTQKLKLMIDNAQVALGFLTSTEMYWS